MTKEDCKKYCVRIYTEYYREIYVYKDFYPNFTRNDVVMFDKFLTYLDEKYDLNCINIDFLINWIEFSFNYWFNRTVRNRGRKIQVNWIFGEKAIKRYEESKTKSFNRFKFRNLRKIVRPKIMEEVMGKMSVQQRDMYLEINNAEEQFKKMNYNTDKCLDWCIINTTLYNHNSNFCVLCKDNQECKRILKTNYKKIYKLRGYE